MGGDHSQKLLPWRGTYLLSGAQQTSGSFQNQHSNSNARNSGLNGWRWRLAGRATGPGPVWHWLSYTPLGSVSESRGWKLLASAEA